MIRVRICTSRCRCQLATNFVVWLTPLSNTAEPPVRISADSPRPQLIQKSKTFEPHVLAVRVGSVVNSPNRGPFFHNVFSLFDGKRFDLGLYEAGATRTVRFDRAGVYFIFCNIHPEISAVVVVVDTPYFEVLEGRKDFRLADVPPG
jgi:plastocyanin